MVYVVGAGDVAAAQNTPNNCQIRIVGAAKTVPPIDNCMCIRREIGINMWLKNLPEQVGSYTDYSFDFTLKTVTFLCAAHP